LPSARFQLLLSKLGSINLLDPAWGGVLADISIGSDMILLPFLSWFFFHLWVDSSIILRRNIRDVAIIILVINALRVYICDGM
jgi:hypothetical protein